MNSPLRIKKSLIINGSGSALMDVQGSQGQLFSITDSLTGTLMSVNDISGLPILEVTSDDKVVMGTFGAAGLTVSGSSIKVGSVSTNVHTVTGSLNISGSTTVNGTVCSITCFVGNFCGNATTATTATTAGNSNCLGGAPQSNYVMTCGNQTIGGVKTFSADISVSKGTGSPATIVSTAIASPLILQANFGGIILSASSGTDVEIKDGATVNMIVKGDTGRVGIGTSTPTAPLQVNGEISGSTVRGAFKTAAGTPGLTQNVAFYDASANYHVITIVDGLIIEWDIQ